MTAQSWQAGKSWQTGYIHQMCSEFKTDTTGNTSQFVNVLFTDRTRKVVNMLFVFSSWFLCSGRIYQMYTKCKRDIPVTYMRHHNRKRQYVFTLLAVCLPVCWVQSSSVSRPENSFLVCSCQHTSIIKHETYPDDAWSRQKEPVGFSGCIKLWQLKCVAVWEALWQQRRF